jgi:hypothetical protein
MTWTWLLGLAVLSMPLQRTCSLDELGQQLLHAEGVVAEIAAAPPLTPAQLKDEQQKLREILASGAFPQPEPESLWARMWNQLIHWLEEIFRRASSGASSTRWVSRILMLALLGIGCGGLIWWLSRIHRKPGLLLRKPVADRTPNGSAAAEWEVWLAQARQLAQEQQWREAIHRVYWAAIARMESRGTWRADRARTPREYLELIDRQSAPGNDLAQLTKALEQFWYGGRTASEQDYSDACRSLERLAAS